jgi:hypothetical protein
MTELELYKFCFVQNKLESHKVEIDNQVDYVLFVPFDLLHDFQNMLGVKFIADNETRAKGVLKSDSMAFLMVDICDYFGIAAFDIFEPSN